MATPTTSAPLVSRNPATGAEVGRFPVADPAAVAAAVVAIFRFGPYSW